MPDRKSTRQERWDRIGDLSKSPLSSVVYQELTRRIISMDIPPGSPLTESMLVKEFNVSRTPVREALRLLRMEGLVQITHTLGARVATSTFKEVLEAYAVRELLDPEAARLASERISEPQLAELQNVLGQVPKEVVHRDDNIKCEQVNRQFHGILLDASGNQTLADTAKRMIWVTQQVTVQLPSPSYQRSLEEHTRILSALRQRDPTEAELAMRVHLEAAKERLLQVV